MRDDRFTGWVGLLAPSVVAIGLFTTPQAASARWHHHHLFGHAATSGGYGDQYYTATSGHRVHREVRSSSAPSGATARCRDSSWSFSESHRGTCSHHGGVASWL